MIIWCLVLMLTPAPSESDVTTVFQSPARVADNAHLAAIGERLQAHKILRAGFKQEKKIKVLRRPLRSSGLFLFAAEAGILWRTDKPFASEFVITPRAVRQKSQGADPIEISVESHPFIHGVTRVFMALFQGDTAALEEQFHLFFTGDRDNWTIGLKPKNRVMKKLIDHIVLQGDTTIQNVRFLETSGDTTLIQFEDVVDSPALSDVERGWFEN